jgi:hypothetical protein
MELLFACGACLLPERWRSRWHHRALPFGTATRLTAGVELLGAFFVFGYALSSHFRAPEAELQGAVVDAVADNAAAAGAFWFVVFWFTWRGLLVSWLLVEGVVRFLHSFNEEPLTTLPLALVDGGWRVWRSLRPPPPPLPDRVTLEDTRLTIASVTPYDWDALTTVRHAGRDWRLRETRWATGAWRHVYILEPAPVEHLLRRVVEYP